MRTNPFEEDGKDVELGTTSKKPIEVPIGLISRVQAKKVKEALNGLIHEVLDQETHGDPLKKAQLN